MVCEQNINFVFWFFFCQEGHPLLLASDLYVWNYGFLTEECDIFFLQQIFIKCAISSGFGKMRTDLLRGSSVKLKMWVLCYYCIIWITVVWFFFSLQYVSIYTCVFESQEIQMNMTRCFYVVWNKNCFKTPQKQKQPKILNKQTKTPTKNQNQQENPRPRINLG